MLRSSAGSIQTSLRRSTVSSGPAQSSPIAHLRQFRSNTPSLATATSSPPPPLPASSSNLRRNLLLSLLGIGSIGGYYIYATNSNSAQSILGPTHFAPLKVISITPITATTSTIKLALPSHLLPESTDKFSNPIKSIYVLQPDLAIQRPYTPLSAASFVKTNGNGDGEGTLDLVVKRYPDGEVSRWLHRLRVGDEVGVRGPVVTWDFKEKYDEIVFIVGGTGVTPAYQLITHLLTPPPTATTKPPSASTTPIPKLTLIYASPTPSEILLQSELNSLASLCQPQPSPLAIKYLVSSPSDEAGKPSWFDFAGAKKRQEQLKGLEKEGVVVGRIGKGNLESWIGRGDSPSEEGKKRVVIVCGPEGMVETIAGPRPRSRAQAEAAHGGILAELGYTKEQVVKL